MSASAEDECPGSGLYIAIGDDERALDGHWVGACPECGGTFALGYAGLLPSHPPEGSKGETAGA